MFDHSREWESAMSRQRPQTWETRSRKGLSSGVDEEEEPREKIWERISGGVREMIEGRGWCGAGRDDEPEEEAMVVGDPDEELVKGS